MTEEFKESSYFKKLISLAITQAHKTIIFGRKKNRFRLGAVLWKRHDILGLGRNWYDKTHTLANVPLKDNDRSKERLHHYLHAEIDSVIGVDRNETFGASILVVRLDPFGNLRMAKPCESCWSFLYNLNIRRIFWSTNEKNISNFSFW